MTRETTPDELRIGVLGDFIFWKCGEVVSVKLSRKTIALLGYLCANPQSHSRKTLAALLCSGAADPMGALRWHVSRLRRLLGEELLEVQRESVAFGWSPEQCDLRSFVEQLKDPGTGTVQQLEEAVFLYRGDFLQGLSIAGAMDFELWLMGERNRLKLLYEQGLQHLVQKLVEAGNYEKAVDFARRLNQSEPLREDTHKILMWLYATLGQQEAALRQFEHCQEILKKELGIASLDSTVDLYEQIQDGYFRVVSHETSKTPTRAKASSLPPSKFEKEEGGFWGRALEFVTFSKLQQVARCIVVEAPLGGGKTQFVLEAARRHSVRHLYAGTCSRLIQSVPYAPWAEMLSSIVQRVEKKRLRSIPASVLEQVACFVPSLAHEFELPLRTPPASGIELEHTFAAIQLFLATLFEGDEVWFFLDNFQWCDEASLRMLQYFLRGNQKFEGFFFCGLTPEALKEDTFPHVFLAENKKAKRLQILGLPPLSEEELIRWFSSVCSTYPKEDQENWVRLLFEVTLGLPSHVETILQEWEQMVHSELPLHESLELKEILERRLDSFSAVERQVAEVLAIFESPVSFEQLLQATCRSEDDLVDALDLGLEKGLFLSLVEEMQSRFCFRNRLLRDCLIAMISPVRLRLLHKRVAIALEHTGGEAFRLAFHWEKAGAAARASDFLFIAGEQAMGRMAYERAVQCFDKASSFEQRSLERGSLLRRKGVALYELGEFEDASEACEEALQVLKGFPRKEALGLCYLDFGRICLQQGDLKRAGELYQRAKAIFSGLDDRMRTCLVYGELGRLHRKMGDFQKAILCYQQKIELVDSLEETEDSGSAMQLKYEGYGGLCMIYSQQGKIKETFACFERMLTLLQVERTKDDELLAPGREGQLTLSKMLSSGGMLEADAYTETLSFLEQEILDSTDAQEDVSLLRRMGDMSALFSWLGDFERAFSFVEKHFDLALQQESMTGLNKVTGNLAELYRFLGFDEQAIRCYTYRLALSLDLGEKRSIATSLGRLALCLSEEDKTESYSLLEWAIQLCEGSGFALDANRFSLDHAGLLAKGKVWEKAYQILRENPLLPEQGDFFFEWKMMLTWCQFETGRLSEGEALSEMEQLQDLPLQSPERALWYRISAALRAKLFPEKEQALKEQAAIRYRELYEKTGNALFARAYKELTGHSIEVERVVLPLPHTIDFYRKPRERLYKRVQKLLKRVKIN